MHHPLLVIFPRKQGQGSALDPPKAEAFGNHLFSMIVMDPA
jgi:hypothetical protein